MTQTIGELRAAVASLGARAWTVAPDLPDDAAVPVLPLGGDDTGRLPVAAATHPDLAQLAVRTAVPELNLRRDQVRSGQLRASVVDWRTRWGGHWLATVQDQNPCNNCWAFAVTALVETMVRIEHGVWSKRSEGDLRDSWGGPVGENWVVRDGPKATPCAHGAGVTGALDWVVGFGIADPGCYPWFAGDHAYTPTADRNGRTVRISGYQTLDVDDAKTWIDTTGPVVASLDVYSDFFGYGGPMPYVKSPTATLAGLHDVLVVGYDDGQQAWIVRNSWGATGWGMGGYGLIGYGQCRIDDFAKYGLRNTNPDPWTRRRQHNGMVFESSNGPDHRNFEMVRGGAPRATHLWRDGGDGGFTWHEAATLEDPADLAAGAGCVGQPAATSTTWNRNFEAVYWELSGRLRHWWMDQDAGKTWHDGGRFGPDDVEGFPGFVQGNYGAPGNLEVVVRRRGGALAHWWRDGAPSFAWHDGGTITQQVKMSGPSLVQANIGAQGNFYVVAVTDWGTLQLWWRDNDNGGVWKAGEVFGRGVGETAVCMIQGTFGTVDEATAGNFELCVAVGGQVQHWWRDNAAIRTEAPRVDVANPLIGQRVVDEPPIRIGDLLGGDGRIRLEPPQHGVLLGGGDEGDVRVRVQEPARRLGDLLPDRWSHSASFGSDVKHVWGLVQGSFGGNLEAVVETNAGALQHWFRDGDGWHEGVVIST